MSDDQVDTPALPEADRHTDPSDQATEIEHRALDYYLHAQRQKAKRHQEPNAAGVYPITECVDCGDDLDPKRVAVAVMNSFCIWCATKREKR